MLVRPVSPQDSEDWERMRTALWPESPGDHPPEIAQFFAEPDDSKAVLVVEDEFGNLCGFVEAGTRPYAEGCLSSPVGYIEGWWVDTEFRGQGYGAALVNAAESWAASLGLIEMASDADLNNTASQRAHRAIGYTEMQRLVCFRKSLQDPE